MTTFDKVHLQIFEIPELHDRDAGLTTGEIADLINVTARSTVTLLRGMAYEGWLESEKSESELTYWFTTDMGTEAAREARQAPAPRVREP